MGNSLRCCLACVLPCGALDLIRIVHLNGHVDEIHRPITAREVLNGNPDHVLTNPCSNGVNSRRILILSPETELKRGEIYFLIPGSSELEKKKKKKEKGSNWDERRRKKMEECDRYLTEIMLEKRSRRERRKPRVAVWRPHLDSIFEDQL